jgi:hypothetical protein
MRFLEEILRPAFCLPLEVSRKEGSIEGFSVFAFDVFLLIALSTGDVFFAMPALLYPLDGMHHTTPITSRQ